MSVNKVILIGHLGADPEIRDVNGSKVANFSLATTEKWKDKATGDRKEETEWHKVVMWNTLAELAEKYLKKGSQIYVEGKLKTRSWEDKEGVKRYMTEVVANQMTFLGGKNNTAPEAGEVKEEKSAKEEVPEGDELPF